MVCQLGTEPAADALGTEVEEDQRARSPEVVPVDVADGRREEVEAHYRISTCDCSAPAALGAIVARRESHIGSQDGPHPAAGEAEEDHLLLKPVGWVLGAEVVVEGRRSLWEATVRSSVVEQTALVVEEERGEEWERLVVGPREVVVAPGLLRQPEAPSRRHLVGRLRSQIDWISAQILGQSRPV